MDRRPLQSPRYAGAWRIAGTAFLFVSGFLLGSCSSPTGKSSPEKPGPAPAAKIEENKVKPISLADLPDIVAKVESLRQRVQRALIPSAEEERASSQLEGALARITEPRQGGGLPFDELLEATRLIAAREQRFAAAGKIVTDRLRVVEAQKSEVAVLRGDTDALARLAGETGTLEQLREQVSLCQRELEDMGARLAERRGRILVDVSRFAEVRGRLADQEAENEANLQEIRGRIAEQSEEPLWRLHMLGRETVALTTDRIAREAGRFRSYAQANAVWLVLITALVLSSMLALLTRLRSSALRRAEIDPDAIAIARVMENPLVASIPVTVLVLILFAPPAPPVVYNLAWIPAAPAAAWIAVKLLGPSVSRTVWVLAASLVLFPFRSAFELTEILARIILLLQTAPLCLAVAYDLLRDRWKGLSETNVLMRLVSGAAWLLVVSLGCAALGTIGGWVPVASFLSTAALTTLGGMILIVASHVILVGLLKTLIASHPAQGLRMVRLYPNEVSRTGLNILRLLAVGTGFYIAFTAFQVATPAGRAVQTVLDAQLTLGSVAISASSRIGIRSSTIRTFDGAEVVVPNADLISKPVTNWTLSNPNRRFDVKVGVAYGSGLEDTAQALLTAAHRTAGVLPEPAPAVYLESFGDSSLLWRLQLWMQMDESPRVLSDLKRAMAEELKRGRIEVPFPQLDIHVHSAAPANSFGPK